MAWTDLLPHFPGLLMQTIQETGHQFTITLVSIRLSDTCPTCQTCTQAGHGWYTRRIHSLPCLGCVVVFLIHAHRFRCPNPTCPRRTFREDLSAVAGRYQRRTQAMTQLLRSIGAVAGGQAGAHLAKALQMPTSRSTLLRCLTHQVVCSASAPRVVGVDDFAWTKGRRYGTILVDLEAHRLLALLPDCEEETVATWFRQHPSVLIVTRDRSPTFAEAIRRGAPQALHIADRFHLHMNAMTCLETLLTREQATIRRVVVTLRTEHRTAHPPPPPQPLAAERQRSERRARRYARYEQVVQLKAQGWSQRAIAQETGLHPQTVAIYLKAGQFPERAPHPPRSRVIEPYLGYLHQRWEQGEHNGRLLFEEIRARGYPAGLDPGLCLHSALAHAWTNCQPGSGERGAPVSLVFPQANPMGAF